MLLQNPPPQGRVDILNTDFIHPHDPPTNTHPIHHVLDVRRSRDGDPFLTVTLIHSSSMKVFPIWIDPTSSTLSIHSLHTCTFHPTLKSCLTNTSFLHHRLGHRTHRDETTSDQRISILLYYSYRTWSRPTHISTIPKENSSSLSVASMDWIMERSRYVSVWSGLTTTMVMIIDNDPVLWMKSSLSMTHLFVFSSS